VWRDLAVLVGALALVIVVAVLAARVAPSFLDTPPPATTTTTE
jgi:hypothetical protein